MSRRARPQREHFSFDSFLDLVTNVVGIIIRLILVVWVGARSYSSLPEHLKHRHAEIAALPAPAAHDDPLHAELERQRRALDDAQKRLLEQLRQLDLTETGQQQIDSELAALASKRDALAQVRGEIDRAAAERRQTVQTASLTLAELEKRREKLVEEIHALEKLPSVKHTLTYRTPVSTPVRAEELHFECRYGRIAFVDVKTFLSDVRRNMEDKGKELRTQWQVQATTEAVGPFRMRYILERQRNTVESMFGGGGPANQDSYGYGLSEWRIEPVVYERGETLEAALKPGSDFRRVVDGLSPTTAVVTIWVYGDSFPAYRQLRDYLQDHEITVAGRPLPDDLPIASSRRGSASRGQ